MLIGVMHVHSGEARLYEATERNDVQQLRFRGHRDLVDAGLIDENNWLGFSICVLGGQVDALFRASVLNRGLDDFAISGDMMMDVLAALAMPRSIRFRSYPRRGRDDAR